MAAQPIAGASVNSAWPGHTIHSSLIRGAQATVARQAGQSGLWDGGGARPASRSVRPSPCRQDAARRPL
ncbi:hypothetical protein J6590_007219 [Homalodisca vitripennis]|nr:hypothetical protein J6590_007219 [Homalodisca vitripennis]